MTTLVVPLPKNASEFMAIVLVPLLPPSEGARRFTQEGCKNLYSNAKVNAAGGSLDISNYIKRPSRGNEQLKRKTLGVLYNTRWKAECDLLKVNSVIEDVIKRTNEETLKRENDVVDASKVIDEAIKQITGIPKNIAKKRMESFDFSYYLYEKNKKGIVGILRDMDAIQILLANADIIDPIEKKFMENQLTNYNKDLYSLLNEMIATLIDIASKDDVKKMEEFESKMLECVNVERSVKLIENKVRMNNKEIDISNERLNMFDVCDNIASNIQYQLKQVVELSKEVSNLRKNKEDMMHNRVLAKCDLQDKMAYAFEVIKFFDGQLGYIVSKNYIKNNLGSLQNDLIEKILFHIQEHKEIGISDINKIVMQTFEFYDKDFEASMKDAQTKITNAGGMVIDMEYIRKETDKTVEKLQNISKALSTKIEHLASLQLSILDDIECKVDSMILLKDDLNELEHRLKYIESVEDIKCHTTSIIEKYHTMLDFYEKEYSELEFFDLDIRRLSDFYYVKNKINETTQYFSIETPPDSPSESMVDTAFPRFTEGTKIKTCLGCRNSSRNVQDHGGVDCMVTCPRCLKINNHNGQHQREGCLPGLRKAPTPRQPKLKDFSPVLLKRLKDIVGCRNVVVKSSKGSIDITTTPEHVDIAKEVAANIIVFAPFDAVNIHAFPYSYKAICKDILKHIKSVYNTEETEFYQFISNCNFDKLLEIKSI